MGKWNMLTRKLLEKSKKNSLRIQGKLSRLIRAYVNLKGGNEQTTTIRRPKNWLFGVLIMRYVAFRKKKRSL